MRPAHLALAGALALSGLAAAALVVNDGEHVITTPTYISAAVWGYQEQVGATVGLRTQEGVVTWRTVDDPHGMVGAVHDCAPPTAPGTNCRIAFSGPPLRLPGTYTFTGEVRVEHASGPWISPPFAVTVKVCALPPC